MPYYSENALTPTPATPWLLILSINVVSLSFKVKYMLYNNKAINLTKWKTYVKIHTTNYIIKFGSSSIKICLSNVTRAQMIFAVMMCIFNLVE